MTKQPNGLNAAFCRSVKPTSDKKPDRYSDRGGCGLMLVVQPSGKKSWIQRITIRGRRHDLGIGSFILVPLAEARETARANLKLARAGGDPLAAKRRETAPTLAEAIETVIELQSPSWRGSGRTVQEWRNSLGRYVIPKLGNKRIGTITPSDVLAVLAPLFEEQPDTARRLRQRISTVMQWAVAHEYISNDPAGGALKAALPKCSATKRRMKAIPYVEVSTALEKIRESKTQKSARLAVEFLVLTAVRSGEARGGSWEEIDRDAAVWVIPAARMKAKQEHRVPLSARALEVLDEARGGNADQSGLIFKNKIGTKFTSSALLRVVQASGIEAAVHGFRSSFRQWAAERTNYPREICEAALAHVVSNQVEAAYQRSDLLEKRRALMDQWAAYINEAPGAKVVRLHV